jgi:hypothetical protein
MSKHVQEKKSVYYKETTDDKLGNFTDFSLCRDKIILSLNFHNFLKLFARAFIFVPRSIFTRSLVEN